MKYSIVNGERCEAKPKLRGMCPACGAETIAKCGTKVIHHWSHKVKRKCDQWWENETEWHRNWKDCFPRDWQEVIHHAADGEKHIADIKTDQGYVIEFQHSYLKPEERKARNDFYEKLIWVVNGRRRKLDKKQFFKLLLKRDPICLNPEVRLLDMGWIDLDCKLLYEWLDAPRPIFFDFGEDGLWCLVPNEQSGYGHAAQFPRRLFIDLMWNKVGNTPNAFEDCLRKLSLLASEDNRNRESGNKLGIHIMYTKCERTQKERDMQKRITNHRIVLFKRFKEVMKPYFGAYTAT